jgi:hypothetical protein
MARKTPDSTSTYKMLGYVWLMRFISGESIRKIAISVGSNRATVAKYIHKAADALTEAAQEKVLQDLFPLALEVYKEKLQLKLRQLRADKDVDVGDAERIMKGMLVFDRPQLKDIVTDPMLEGDEVTTLAGLMVKRIQSRGEVIEGEKVDETKAIDSA